MHRLPFFSVALAIMIVCAIAATPARAQLNTQHLKGIPGLKSGSQPPPHKYVVGPLIYIYTTDTVRNADGDRFPIDASISMVAGGAGFNHVTTKKILGGNYAYSVLVAGINNRLQGTDIDLNPGGGLTDTGFVPIQLGWHSKRADAMAAFTMYLPTGRYNDGATNNLGLGMWGFEPEVGATVYLTESKQFHAATLASFTFQTKKEDSDTKVGTAMNLEGGIGGDFVQGGLTAGLVYYATFKLEEDRIDGIPSILIRGKNRVLALGPEVTFAIASKSKGMVYGFVKVNYQWEVYAKTNTQGSTMTIMASFPVPAFKLGGT